MLSNPGNAVYYSEWKMDEIVWVVSKTSVAMESDVWENFSHNMGARAAPVGVAKVDNKPWVDIMYDESSFNNSSEVGIEVQSDMYSIRAINSDKSSGDSISVDFRVVFLAADNNSIVAPSSDNMATTVFDGSDKTMIRVHKEGAVTKPNPGSNTTEKVTVSHNLGYIPVARVLFDEYNSQTTPDILGATLDPNQTSSREPANTLVQITSSDLKVVFPNSDNGRYIYQIYENQWP